MAKPRSGLPGNSGHIHISVVDKSGKNMFVRESEDKDAQWSDIRFLSDIGRQFLAGILDGLADIMPIVAPTVNSYKRLVENFWAPVTVSWGLEHRAASIRLITPPSASAKSTRLEVRVPGADSNPYLVLGAVLALGWRGVEKKLKLSIPPLGKGEDVGGEADKGARLAKSLKEATERFTSKDSIAREVFSDEFVDHYGGSREHEIRLWDEAVTDWYVCPSPRMCDCSLCIGKSSGISKWSRNAFRRPFFKRPIHVLLNIPSGSPSSSTLATVVRLVLCQYSHVLTNMTRHHIASRLCPMVHASMLEMRQTLSIFLLHASRCRPKSYAF